MALEEASRIPRPLYCASQHEAQVPKMPHLKPLFVNQQGPCNAPLSQHHLGLGDERDELAILGLQPRLPDLGPPSPVHRRRRRNYGAALLGAANEIGLALDRGSAL